MRHKAGKENETQTKHTGRNIVDNARILAHFRIPALT